MSKFNVHEIGQKGNMKLTITDNVLDPEDWPIWSVVFNYRGTVVVQSQLKQGVYSPPNMVDWNLAEIQNWLDYDPTGNHPEVYNSIFVNELQ